MPPFRNEAKERLKFSPLSNIFVTEDEPSFPSYINYSNLLRFDSINPNRIADSVVGESGAKIGENRFFLQYL